MQIRWEVLHPKKPKDWDGLVMQPFVWRDSLFAIGGLSSGRGNIVRSDDGGASWTEADFDSTKKRGTSKTYGKMMGLRHMTAGDGDQLFACGEYGTVLGSRDGGRTWKMSSEAALGGCVFGIKVRRNSLWISGDDGIWERPIGKGSWNEEDDTAGLARIYELGTDLLVIGDAGVLKRIDENDAIHDIETGVEEDLYGLAWPQPGKAVICGNDGLILLWDGRSELTRVKSGVDVSLMSVTHAGDARAVIAGHDQTILVSEDAGATWSKVPGPKDNGGDLWGIAFDDRTDTLLVTGDDGLIARGWLT